MISRYTSFCDFRNLHDGIHYHSCITCTLHRIREDRGGLATGKDVQQKTLEAELCTICAARIGSTRGGTPLSCMARSTMSMTCMLGSIFSFMLSSTRS